MRYLWGPRRGASSVRQPPSCGPEGGRERARGAAAGRGGASKHRLRAPQAGSTKKPAGCWRGPCRAVPRTGAGEEHGARAHSCAMCLQKFHPVWLLEADPPESLWGPGLSNKTLDLPTVWKISMFALGLSLDPALRVWPGLGLLRVCVSQPRNESPECAAACDTRVSLRCPPDCHCLPYLPLPLTGGHTRFYCFYLTFG